MDFRWLIFEWEERSGGKAVAQRLGPRDAVRRGEAFVDEIERGEQQQRLVGALVRTALGHRRGADVQVVESLDRRGWKHGS